MFQGIPAAHRRPFGPAVKPIGEVEVKLEGFFSTRISDQWDVIFKWIDGDAYEVRVVDYH
ncbi:MAG: hypothetical protein WBE05_27450 [Pseudolabrys sp.]